MGLDGVRACLQAGANDLGGTLMNESISRAAGASHGQELDPSAMEALSPRSGARRRSGRRSMPTAPPERRRAAREAAPLAPVIQTPARRVANVGMRRPATEQAAQP